MSVVAMGDDSVIIRDPRGDIQASVGPTSVDIAVPEIDILEVEATQGPDSMLITWRVDDLSHRALGEKNEEIDLVLTFVSAQYELGIIGGTTNFGRWFFTFSGHEHDGDVVQASLDGVADLALSELRVIVPSHLFEPPLTQTKATGLLSVRHGSGTTAPDLGVWFRDLAPDDGYGQDIE